MVQFSVRFVCAEIINLYFNQGWAQLWEKKLAWGTEILVNCLILGLIGWFLARRNESAIFKALTVRKPEQNKALDNVQVCTLLATVRKTLSCHSELLGSFERTLEASDDGRCDFSTIGGIRQANQSVEQTIETTIEGLVAACSRALREEQSSPESYREETNALETTREGSELAELLVPIAGILLDMVRELRAENRIVQNEVAAGKDQIIHLLGRASSAEQMARVDILTGLPNRQALTEAYARCEQLQDETEQAFSLIMMDIDHFKSVNDEFGHLAGDSILLMVAKMMREICKTGDLTCRLGGEEFAVLLPRCAQQAAKSIAEHLRQEIGSATLRHSDHEISITISCGVAEAIPGELQADLMSKADIALYAAKSRGRNQTCVYADLDVNEKSLVQKDVDRRHARDQPVDEAESSMHVPAPVPVETSPPTHTQAPLS